MRFRRRCTDTASQRGRGRVTLSIAVGLAGWWLQPGVVEAAAWNEDAGHGIVIVDYTLSGGAKYFDGAGKLSRASAYSKQEAVGYVEYGVTDWLTAILKPSLSMISAATSTDPGSPTHHYEGLGTSEAAVQLHLLTFGPAVLAVQGGFRLPSSTSHANAALIGNTSRDTDLRGLAGIGFGLGPWPAFLDVESGYRFRSGGAAAEWHADATLGVRFFPRVTMLMQSFNVLCDGQGTAWFPQASYSKLGASAVYDVTDRWSLQLGAFQTMLGEGALRERGFQAAVWYRF